MRNNFLKFKPRISQGTFALPSRIESQY